jgi:hypothetical protein
MTTIIQHTLGDSVLQLSVPKRRRWGGGGPEFRWLLLGPRPHEQGFRPLLAAGDIHDGEVTADHGDITDEQAAEIARCAAS